MRDLGIYLILFAWGLSCYGQPCTTDRYLKDIFPSSVMQDVVYANAPALTAVYVAENVTVDQDMTMDVYFPVGDVLPKRPAVVLAYGGAYIFGTKEDEDVRATCDSLAKKGYVTASINYRMNLNVADPASAVRAIYRAAQDYHAAIRYLKEFSGSLGIDTNYIFVGGVSAGGFSAMHAVFLDDSERPAETYQWGLFGQAPDLGCISCVGNSYQHTAKVRGVINLWGALLDTSYIQQDELVPMTLFHGTNDLLVPYGTGFPFTALFLMPEVYGSYNIAARVNHLGGEAELNTFEGVGHNIWGVNVNNQLTPGPTEYWVPISDSIVSFLYENIRPEAPTVQSSTPMCTSDTAWFHASGLPLNGRVCWDIEQGTVVWANADSSQVGVVWSSAGDHTVRTVSYNHLEAASVPVQQQVSVYISPEVSVTDLGGTLQASGNYNSYQWYLDGVPLPGATNSELVPIQQGTYTVEATSSNGCSAFSDPLVLVGISHPQYVQIPATVEVYDLIGQRQCSFSTLAEFVSWHPKQNGLYLIRFTRPDGSVYTEKRYLSAP